MTATTAATQNSSWKNTAPLISRYAAARSRHWKASAATRLTASIAAAVAGILKISLARLQGSDVADRRELDL